MRRMLCVVSIFLLFGCITPTPEWYESRSGGWKVELQAAAQAAEAYHFIADSSVTALRGDRQTMQTASALVTSARDKFRRAQSYGKRKFYLGMEDFRDLSCVGLSLHIRDIAGLADDLFLVNKYRVFSVRGRPILDIQGTTATWHDPFRNIAMSDSMMPIEDLVFRIKRE